MVLRHEEEDWLICGYSLSSAYLTLAYAGGAVSMALRRLPQRYAGHG